MYYYSHRMKKYSERLNLISNPKSPQNVNGLDPPNAIEGTGKNQISKSKHREKSLPIKCFGAGETARIVMCRLKRSKFSLQRKTKNVVIFQDSGILQQK
jgi:hypothetical protein